MNETTQKQLEANRQNAQLGGVKTDEGKAITRFNAVRHGLTSNLLSKVDADINFSDLISALKAEFKPAGFIEEVLVERIAINFIRMARATKIEKNLIDSVVNPPALTKKYINQAAQEKYEYDLKVYERKMRELSFEDKLEEVYLCSGARPEKPTEPKFELVENKGEEAIFSKEQLDELAMVFERYYINSENRFYKSVNELKELRGGNIYDFGFVSQNNPTKTEQKAD